MRSSTRILLFLFISVTLLSALSQGECALDRPDLLRTPPDGPYPRPQLVCGNWQNLDGEWDYAITPVAQENIPDKWEGKIQGPFALESKSSGVGRRVGMDHCLWYRTTFAPPAKKGDRLILNFGAVDWRATVFVNGKEVGVHEGGFTPFSFDITDMLDGSGPQELVVRVRKVSRKVSVIHIDIF